MFSAEESKKVREEFWTSFGKEYPRKWILYNTKIKEIQLKFTFNRRFAQVSIDIAAKDDLIREYYYEKFQSLQKVIETTYIKEVIFDKNYELPEGKLISRIYVEMENVNIHNKKDWAEVKAFLAENMSKLESIFIDFEDFIKA